MHEYAAEEVRMHSNEKPAVWQRKLRFEDEEIWTLLPASVREQCLTLGARCRKASQDRQRGAE